MKKIISYSLLLLFVIPIQFVFAEDAPVALAPDNPSMERWEKSMQEVKDNTLQVRTETEAITAQYENMKREMDAIDAQVVQLELDNKAKEAQVAASRSVVHQKKGEWADWKTEIKKVQQEIQDMNVRQDQLRNQLASLEEINQLWQLKVNDLEAQKSLLLIDGQSMDSPSAREKIEESIKNIQEQLKASQENELELQNSLAMAREEEARLTKDVKKLRSDRELSNDVAFFKKSSEAKPAPSVGADGSGPSMENQEKSSEVYGEKEQLLKEIESLEGQVAEYRNTLDGFEQSHGEKRDLVDRIIALDEKNQDFRLQIAMIRQEISELRKNAKFLKNRTSSSPGVPKETILYSTSTATK